MILSIIIILLIIYNIYCGYRAGLVTEFVRIISYGVAWLISQAYFKDLSRELAQLFSIPNSQLMAWVSFLIIFLITTTLLQALGRAVNHVTYFPIIHQLNSIGGALIGFLIGNLLTWILLSLALALPFNWIQNQFVNSPVAIKIVQHTPSMTHHLIEKGVNHEP